MLNGSSGDLPHELDGVNFVSVSQPTTEPGTLVLALLGLTLLGVGWLRR